MIKNIKYTLIFLFLLSCGYSPIYQTIQKINFKLNVINFSGDNEIGREIIKSLEKFKEGENSNIFKGYYHILGGVLNALDGVGPDQLNIEKLGKRIKQNQVQEIILALSATIDGQTTLHFLIDYLEDFNVKVTKLAHGIPIGGELDYLDDGTLTQAILSRTTAD